MIMTTEMASRNASDGNSREEQVMKPDDVNLLEFGELIDDICSHYVEEEIFNADNVIDSYDFFYNQSNEMFMNNNVNQSNGAESFLQDFHLGEEVSVATINPGEELSTIEIDSINNLYDEICNESEQQTENVPELFNMPIDEPEQLNFNSQQDISYVNHFDTELGQNIWYDDNLENIVPNFDCDMLPFSEVGLSYSDPQQVNSLDSNKYGNCNKYSQNIVDHTEYTISADLMDNNQNNIPLYKNIINDSFCNESFHTVENPLPSVETNVSSIFRRPNKIVENIPLTNQNQKDISNIKNKTLSLVTSSKSPINTSRFQRVMKIKNHYMKYSVVDNPLTLNKMRFVNKPNIMNNLQVIHRSDLKNVENPLMGQCADDNTLLKISIKHNTRPINKCAQTNRKDKVKSVGISTDAVMKTISNVKVNTLPKKQYIEMDNDVDKIRKFDFSVDSSLLNIFSSLKRSSKKSSELCKDNFINNNEKIQYYTGIPGYQYFIALLNCLDLPSIPIATPFEMLLLTLVKIKLNLDWTDLAYRFGESVQCVKDIFGLTVSIIFKCLPKLIQWLPECIHFDHGSLIFYVLKVDLIPKNACDVEYAQERLFICMSNSTHPVMFISNPISEHFSNGAELLEKSGIRQRLAHGDIIMFDSSVCLLLSDILDSVDLSRQPTNAIPLDKRIFQLQTFEGSQFQLVRKSSIMNKKLLNQVRHVQKIASLMFNFNFINDSIRCEWFNDASHHELFCDVLRIVCGILNLCNILPYTKRNVKTLIDERKNIRIAIA